MTVAGSVVRYAFKDFILGDLFNTEGRTVRRQITKSGTSIGANK
jgi:hypothetical protein